MIEPHAPPLRRRHRRVRRGVGIALAALLATTAAAARAADDPLVGRWLGTIGPGSERIEAGIELRPEPDGGLRLFLTQPILNLYGSDSGVVERAGDTVRLPALHLELTRRGDVLEGHFPGPRSAARFERARRLPVDPEPPRLPEGPAPRWETRLNGQVWASPAVVDGIVYVGTTGGVLNAVDARDGRLVWTYATGGAIHGAAAVDGEAVYVVSDDGGLHQVARADGARRWRYDLGDGAVGRVLPHPAVFDWDWQGPRPLVVDGTVFVGAGDGGFHAVAADSGTRRWRFDTRGRIRGGAAVDGPRVVFGSGDHHVYALERASGREVWRFDTGGHVDTAPLVHDGRVIIGNRGFGLYALDAATGAERWKTYFWGSWVESAPTVAAGTLYIGASDLRRVSALDPATGRVLWRSDVFGWTFGTPLVEGDRLHVGALGGTPYVIRHRASYATLDRRTGRLLTRRPIADPGGHQWGIAGSLQRHGDTVIYATLAGSLVGIPIR